MADETDPAGAGPGLSALAEAGIPVLRTTAVSLARLAGMQERVSGSELSQTLLRDPLMTLRVLRFLQAHRARSQTVDITTIAHALMMLGLARFFREFHDLPVLEDHLGADPSALATVLAALSRGRHAALYARDWAVVRHDMDPEEVMIAALLHDVTDIVAAVCLPAQAGAHGPLSSDERRGLLEAWNLPALLIELGEDRESGAPRVANVALACELAAASAGGWFAPELPALFDRIQRLLHISAPELMLRVRRVSLATARDWRCYGVRPSAYFLPQYPSESGTAPG